MLQHKVLDDMSYYRRNCDGVGENEKEWEIAGGARCASTAKIAENSHKVG